MVQNISAKKNVPIKKNDTFIAATIFNKLNIGNKGF